MGPLDQGVEVFEAAEQAVDVGVVGDIVAHVFLRALEDRGEPEGVDAEPGDVVEAAQDTRQVADAVAIAVLERARIDLIDNPAAPPLPHQSLRHSLLPMGAKLD